MPSTIPPEVRTLVASLDLRDRQVLLLHYVDELTPHEISVLMKTPRTTILEILDRLRAAFRRVLSSVRAGAAVS